MTPSFQDQIHRYLAEELADGDWHPLEPILAMTTRLVPPGLALRRRERNRLRKKQTDVVHVVSSEEAIRRGARRVVRDDVLGRRPDRPYDIRINDDGSSDIKMTKLPGVVRGDRLREQQLRGTLDGLADHFTAAGLAYAAEQVQLAAHEVGFHLNSCPSGCRLVRVVTRTYTPPGPSIDEEKDADVAAST